MRLTFHGGLLLAAISAAAEATTLLQTGEDDHLVDATSFAQTDLEVESSASARKSSKDEKKKKEPKGVMAGIGQIATGVAKQANKVAKQSQKESEIQEKSDKKK